MKTNSAEKKKCYLTLCVFSS